LQKDETVEKRLKQLAHKKMSYGYRRLHILLRREGYKVNHKRTYALYAKNKLAKRKKKRKRTMQHLRKPLKKASKPNERWAMDFMSDSCSNGRKIKTLNVIDLYARECLKIEVGSSLPSSKVIEALEEIALERGLPEVITVDNGTEYTSKVIRKWAKTKGVHLDYIAPGRPMQNGYVESFNGKFREECLDQNWFQNIQEASIIIEKWRKDYNNNRPHSALGYLTPNEYLRRKNQEKVYL
jgi:putative transposase